MTEDLPTREQHEQGEWTSGEAREVMGVNRYGHWIWTCGLCDEKGLSNKGESPRDWYRLMVATPPTGASRVMIQDICPDCWDKVKGRFPLTVD